MNIPKKCFFPHKNTRFLNLVWAPESHFMHLVFVISGAHFVHSASGSLAQKQAQNHDSTAFTMGDWFRLWSKLHFVKIQNGFVMLQKIWCVIWIILKMVTSKRTGLLAMLLVMIYSVIWIPIAIDPRCCGDLLAKKLSRKPLKGIYQRNFPLHLFAPKEYIELKGG